MNTRALATSVLQKVLSQGKSLAQVLPPVKEKCSSSQDAAFLQMLSYGVIRFYPRLCFLADQLIRKPLKSKDQDLYFLILIGIYQLSNLDVPAYAALQETVEATKVLKKNWATGFVNATLRTYQRQGSDLEKQLPTKPEALYSHPTWFIQAIQKAWPEQWQSILLNNNQQPPLTLRVNRLKKTREQYLSLLNESAITGVSLAQTSSGIILDPPLPITELPGFSEGFFSVQDGASQLVADQLKLSPGLRVLDACAAPGGKTSHLLETEPNISELVAIELSESRTKTIFENLKRLQLQATVITADAQNPSTWWDNKPFDRILLDAPCSSSGVIRRHPDIKFLRKFTDIAALQAQQLDLLRALWPLLEPNGILLYTTCSIFPKENVEVIQQFLSEVTATPLPLSLPTGIPQTLGHQILPGQDNLDGFYYACLQK